MKYIIYNYIIYENTPTANIYKSGKGVVWWCMKDSLSHVSQQSDS